MGQQSAKCGAQGCKPLCLQVRTLRVKRVEWKKKGIPVKICLNDLQRVAELASCALIARHWPSKGSRHDAALALAGFLLQGGVEREKAKKIFLWPTKMTTDEDWEDRQKCFEDTDKKLSLEIQLQDAQDSRVIDGDGSKVVAKLPRLVGN